MKYKPFILAGAALGAVAAVVLLDRQRPHKGSTRTNPRAPAYTRQRRHVAATPERVWQVLSNLEDWPRWQPDIKAMRLLGPLRPGTEFDWQLGPNHIHSVLHTVAPSAALGWSGWSFGAAAVHNWTLTPQVGGTDVEVEESLDGWLVRLLASRFRRRLDAATHRWLEQLQRAAELG